jgi:hypothetical protein
MPDQLKQARTLQQLEDEQEVGVCCVEDCPSDELHPPHPTDAEQRRLHNAR